MEIGNGLDLSRRKVAYIKYIFERGVTVKTNDLALHFAVDPSTITKTMNELTEAGLLTHEPYRGVSLSKKGKLYAEFLVKRHRILSLALTHYGLSHDDACREVSRFESLVTKETIDTMCRAMGHPHSGICGEITHDPGCMETGSRT
jgi:DtxR family transcriptional regulator, Mn-dependent transcriptional regulator